MTSVWVKVRACLDYFIFLVNRRQKTLFFNHIMISIKSRVYEWFEF